MKKLYASLALAGLVTVPSLAAAADSPHSFSGNVSLTSNYVFRGISQTGGDPAIQGGLDYSHSSGFYLGTWASNVGWIEDFQGYDKGNMEIDLYGGYRGSFDKAGISYDLGIIGYFYPGDKAPTIPNADTTEVYAALGWKWFTVKYSYVVSDGAFGFGKPLGSKDATGSDYWDISASLPIGETGLTAGAHWGTFSFDNYPDQDYDDWKVSLTYDMGKASKLMEGVTVGVAYSDTNARKTAGPNGGSWTDLNGKYLGESTTYFWISKAL
ncbi:MAG: TorF family putative porin [Pseudomonadota bacterium]